MFWHLVKATFVLMLFLIIIAMVVSCSIPQRTKYRGNYRVGGSLK